MLCFTLNALERWFHNLHAGISTVSDLNAFFVLTQKTADGWAFEYTAKGNVKPTGRETPAETGGGAPGNALQVLPGAPPPVSGQQQCKALLPSARLWRQSWFGTNQNILPAPQQFPLYTILLTSSLLEHPCSHKKACAGPAFDLHMRTVGQREALLMGVKRGLAPLAGVQRTASSGKRGIGGPKSGPR